jgi:hypothetical protein
MLTVDYDYLEIVHLLLIALNHIYKCNTVPRCQCFPFGIIFNISTVSSIMPYSC